MPMQIVDDNSHLYFIAQLGKECNKVIVAEVMTEQGGVYYVELPCVEGIGKYIMLQVTNLFVIDGVEHGVTQDVLIHVNASQGKGDVLPAEFFGDELQNIAAATADIGDRPFFPRSRF